MLSYTRKIYQELFPEKDSGLDEHEGKAMEKPEKPEANSHQNLVEELSSRELEVLELISRGL